LRKETLAKMEKRIKMQEEQIIRNIREYNVRTINNQEML
jgi:hypothetical protein